ncbi:uncharacterized protein SPPG_09301 [Spizellomyces punctatus DAOM BR117]|uniref:ABC transporter domain-containing protein n=1 Tax=Spizellomyces punctatus (strain DAOM BR117) TaxID=645134 RepID=A0A0L0HCP4_SPIPD|nr:uncharacterized protein SPPG_09301 [Spizellomyces punctatus DAOM BR117]KNC98741.1 hypothetical protein SPPG_09301 [Spizellomyces punctatus DAOM BR117]|eukprot:XP_016606781.1 hypothetical protein SPPG_09301 [Spizellomyces punctatus DAOM BR117]
MSNADLPHISQDAGEDGTPLVRTNTTGRVIWQGRLSGEQARPLDAPDEIVVGLPSQTSESQAGQSPPQEPEPNLESVIEVRETSANDTHDARPPQPDRVQSLTSYQREMAFGEPLAVKKYVKGEAGEIFEEVSDDEEETDEGIVADAPYKVEDHDVPMNDISKKKSRSSLASGKSGKRRKGGVDPRKDDFDFEAWLHYRQKKYNEAGFIVPEVILTYKDLAVFGDPVVQPYIETVGKAILNTINIVPPIRRMTRSLAGNPLPKPENRQILYPMNGFCKPGEMTLVLGRPGAGCSTLLRTLANVTEGLSEVRGDVAFNGIDNKTFKKQYSSSVAYNPETDPHFASLTVRQTLRFALECRIGGAVEERRRERIEEWIDVCVRVFGLQNCADTKVGDEMIRGCSGGEKKRVSIAEQLCVAASMGFWDGSTKGLDSSSALDFVRALRVLTDITQTGNVLSLYQASQDIYDLFDKVCLIADGRCIYFGPAKDAKPYFESIGFFCPKRKVTPDFLTGITEPMERDVQKGWESKVPNTTEEFEAMFRQSDVFRRMEKDREALLNDVKVGRRGSIFGKQVLSNKQVLGRDDLLKTQYTTSLWQQIKANFKREVNLQKGNVALIGRVFFDTFMAIIIGSAFFQLEPNVSGAFSRGGVLFFALLYNCFGALASVPLVIQGRAVAAKHKSYKLYRTYISPLIMQAVDIPVSIVMIIIWSCINYWMVGLKATAGAFFSYMAFLFAANQAFGGMVRIVASLAPNLEAATQINGIFLLFFILYTGYIIPYPSMQPVLKYIFWINPLAYGLRALLENEFDGQQINCDGAFLPPYPNVPDANKGCAMKGSVPGQPYVDGMAYLRESFGYGAYNRWFNFLILMGFWVVIIFGMMAANKYVDYSPRSYSINMWKKAKDLAGRPGRKHKGATQQQNGPADLERGPDGSSVPTSGDPNSAERTAAKVGGIIRAEAFTWKHINYTVPTKDGPKQLLNDVSGYVRPGELTALMGSSGAGKTTLIDAITQRKTIGKLEGQIYVGTHPQDNLFKKNTAYCEQMDVHNPGTSVREALRFSARLRQEHSVPLEEKYAFVETVIGLLELEPIADAVIGDSATGVGISNEQRKRVTIGVELVAKPKILFLDEPTSGLDSQAAFNIIRLLRNLANSGQAILCTIHQPSAVLFEQFDSLLLLARGGRVVYFGELGQDCEKITGYFESQGAPPCPPTANVAEYMLDVIGAGTARRDATRDWPELWKENPRFQQNLDKIDEIRGVGDTGAKDVSQAVHLRGKAKREQFAAPFSTQLGVVWKRMLISYWRNPEYNYGRVLSQIMAALLIGFTFFQLTNSVTDMQNKVFAIFMAMTIGALLINLVQPNYIRNRSWFTREAAAGFYDWKAFALSITTAEIPFALLAATCFFVIFYFLAGLNGDSSRAFYFWLIYVVFNFFGVSLGQMIAAVSPTLQFAAVLNPFFLSMQMLFCGVTITYAAMPKFWRSWLYHIDPFRYFVEGVIGNELGGVPVTCEGNEVTIIYPPSGQTCSQYFQPFFQAGGPGQLRDPSSSSVCEYCMYAVGDQFVERLGWSFDNRWRNFGILCGFWAFNIVAVALLVRLYRTGR